MDSTLIFRNDDGTTNSWRSHDIGVDRLATDEYNSLLGEAYLFWSDYIHPATAFDLAKRGSSAGTKTSRPSANPALETIFRVDCTSPNPFDFVIDLPLAKQEAVAIRDLKPDCLRRIVALDINYARGQRKPLYQNIKQEIDGIARDCYRLLLPVAGTASHITEIFGFCRPESVAQPLDPLDRQRMIRRRSDSVNDL